MATRPVPNQNREAQADDESLLNLAGTDIKVALPRWTKNILVVITVLGSIGGTIAGLKTHVVDDRANDAKSRLADTQIAEAIKHSADHFDTMKLESAPGSESIELRYYRSDACIQVARRTPDGILTSSYFVPRINASQLQPAPGAVGDVHYTQTGTVFTPDINPPPATVLPADLQFAAWALPPQPQLTRVQACGGQCPKQHAGQPRTTNGKINGCWIQVIRTWDDGCSQYQWYDTCHSIWDPKIYWSCCRH